MSITIVFPALCFTLLCSGGACFHPRPPAAQRRFYNFTTQSHKKAITALPQAAPAIALKFQTPAPRAGGDARKKHLVLIALFFAMTPALTPCQWRSLRGPLQKKATPQWRRILLQGQRFCPCAALFPAPVAGAFFSPLRLLQNGKPPAPGRQNAHALDCTLRRRQRFSDLPLPAAGPLPIPPISSQPAAHPQLPLSGEPAARAV